MNKYGIEKTLLNMIIIITFKLGLIRTMENC